MFQGVTNSVMCGIGFYICTMMETVTEVKYPEEYQMSIDMTEFKRDFAILMAKLEEAEEAENEPESVKDDNIDKHNDMAVNIKPVTHQKRFAVAAAAVGVTLVNVAFIGISRLIRK